MTHNKNNNKHNKIALSFVVLLMLSLTASMSNASTQDIPSQIVDIFSSLTQQEYSSGNPWLRQAHAKQHGCVTALVQVLPNLPTELAQGVFANQTEYPAFIRFSNGVGRGFTPLLHANESDLVPDIRGMGIKLLNVSGPFMAPNANTQVFTLTTAQEAFLDTAEHALSFFQAVQKGNLALTGWLALHPRLAILYAAQAVVIPNLLTQDWFSPVPQMHGPYIVKHHVYPCDDTLNNNNNMHNNIYNNNNKHNNNNGFTKKSVKGERAGFDFNYLRETLQEDLQAGSACFRWAVQFYQNEDYTPVNDSTVPWETPFQDIAVIKIPSQSSWDEGQDTFCRFMSFNPGSTIAAHAPVGPIPEIRNAVYAAMATLRHKLNNQVNRDVTYADWVNYSGL